MSSPLKFGPCNLYLTPMWVKLPSTPDVEVQLTPLSHASISTSHEISYLLSKLTEFSNIDTYITAVQRAISGVRGAYGFPSLNIVVEQLPSKDVVYLYRKLQEISMVSNEQLQELGKMLDIRFNPMFSGESWDCTVCQEKGLDYSRACGLLPKEKRDPKPVLPRVNGMLCTECPIATIDNYVVSQAVMAYTLFDAGVLPEAGGVGNQTEWFVRASLMYKRKVAEAERAAMDKIQK